MTVRVELTASHMGYFEFRLCDDIYAKQKCLDKNLLKIVSGSPFISFPNDISTRFYPRNGSRIYEIRTQLPKDLECERCVLQWKYIAGNNWGICKDGNGAVGCGPQEEFRACSDVAIGKGAVSSIPALKPSIKPTSRPTEAPNDEDNEIDHDHDHEHSEVEPTEDNQKPTTVSNFYGAIIAIFTFFLVLLAIASIYIYFYHGDFLKRVLRRQQISQNPQQKVPLDTSSISSIASSDLLPPPPPPVRPPRQKSRNITQTLSNISHDHSSILGSEKQQRNLQLV